jgi:hypothetical protein
MCVDMRYFLLISFFFCTSFCMADVIDDQAMIKKNMYKKRPLFKNETSLALLRKMQVYRIKHGIY